MNDAPTESYAERRRKLKAQVLGALADDVSVTVGDVGWGAAEDLGLSEDTFYAVCDEVSAELRRRVKRLEADRG